MRRRRAGTFVVALALAASGARAESLPDLPVLARVGAWPVASSPIAYDGRLWMVNGVKGVNHNAADLYSYDPARGALRFERSLFSQDAGRPLVHRGLLYWPFEDSRWSLGWGRLAVTDGRGWSELVVPTAEIFHVHALAATDGGLVAATSAWRAGLQVSGDGGSTWSALYDHPTPPRRVSRIVALAGAGKRLFGVLIDPESTRLVQVVDGAVRPVPGWPAAPVLGLAVRGARVYALLREAGGVSLWASDGRGSERLAAPRAGWRLRALAAGPATLWAAGGGRLWRSGEGRTWRAVAALPGGTPWGIALLGGAVYVTGAGDDGRGILWGPAAPPAVPPAASAPSAEVLPRLPPAAAPDWRAAGAALDALLAEPGTYADHGAVIRDRVFALARARPPAAFWRDRLAAPMPAAPVALIGNQVPRAALGRWILLWGMSLAGRGRVPPDWLSAPWRTPANPSEKYFQPAAAAIQAAAALGQDDPQTLTALLGRLQAGGDPDWLRGDLFGALAALTSERFGSDPDAWLAWGRQRRLIPSSP